MVGMHNFEKILSVLAIFLHHSQGFYGLTGSANSSSVFGEAYVDSYADQPLV